MVLEGELSKESLQSCVLGPGLLQDGDAGVGVFPQREKILVSSLRFRAVAGQGIRAAKAKMRECGQRLVSDHACMFEDFLEFVNRCGPLLRCQVRFAAQVNWIKGKGEGRIRFTQFIRGRLRQRVDGSLTVTTVKRGCSSDHRKIIELYDGVLAESFPQIGGQTLGLRGIASKSECKG
jgi:hypothetical protein